METETRNLTVAGMTCGHCESSVKSALEAIAGVQGASASSTTGEVVVTLDPQLVQEAALAAAITEAGFELR